MRRLACVLMLSILVSGGEAVHADTAQEQLAAASALFNQRKFASAAQTLETFLTQNPGHAKTGVAVFTLGRCRLELKQYDKAIPAFQKAISTKDADVTTLAQLGLAEAAMNTQKYALAAPALEAAVKTSLKQEQAPTVWFWLGEADYHLKRYAPSEEAYGHVFHDYAQSDLAAAATYGAGLAALQQNKTDVAREDLTSFVQRYPQNPDRPRARLQLAQMDLDAKNWSEARTGLEALLRDTGSDAANAKLHAETEDGLIQALLELGDYAAAIPHLEAALERLPENDPLRYRAELSLGNCHYKQQQYRPALIAYRVAAKSPAPAVAAEGQYWEANSLLSVGNPTEAAAQFTEFATRFPSDKRAPHALIRAGDALLAAKHNERASAAYQAVLVRYPKSPAADEARKALGAALDGISTPTELTTALTTVTGQEREHGVARLARMYLETKKYADAEQVLTDLIKSDPTAHNAGELNYLLGVACEAQQKQAAALTALASAVRLTSAAPWTADAQTRLAWLYVGAKQPERAEKAANAALESQPTEALTQQARLALVQALIDQKKWEPALQGCQALMEGQPSPATAASALYTQAWIEEKRGRAADALPLWERLSTEYPKSDYTADALLHLGDAQLKAEKYEEARDRFSTLLSHFPKSRLATSARFKLGSTLFNLNRPDEAATEFDALVNDKAAGALEPEALYWAGVSYNKAGKKAAAMQRLTRLVQEYPQNTHVSNAKVYLAALKVGG